MKKGLKIEIVRVMVKNIMIVEQEHILETESTNRLKGLGYRIIIKKLGDSIEYFKEKCLFVIKTEINDMSYRNTEFYDEQFKDLGYDYVIIDRTVNINFVD